MKRILTAVAAAALGLGLLSACGDDDSGSADGSGDYCADLKAVQKQLDSVADGDIADLEETLDSLKTLKDEAPDEIADDWDVLYTAFDKIVTTFKDAGLSAEDIEAIQNGQVPDGVDQDTLQDAFAEVAALGSDEELTGATENIQEHAKDECGVTLQ